MPIQFRQDNVHEFRDRFIYLVIVCCLFFIIVVSRLYYLQIVKGSYYRLFSNENTLKEIEIPAIRGIIYDRNRIPIVQNRPSFDITITPQYIKDFNQTKLALMEIAQLSPEYLDKKWQEAKKLPPFFPITIEDDVAYDVIAKLKVYHALGYHEGDHYDLRGVEVMAKP